MKNMLRKFAYFELASREVIEEMGIKISKYFILPISLPKMVRFEKFKDLSSLEIDEQFKFTNLLADLLLKIFPNKF